MLGVYSLAIAGVCCSAVDSMWRGGSCSVDGGVLRRIARGFFAVSSGVVAVAAVLNGGLESAGKPSGLICACPQNGQYSTRPPSGAWQSMHRGLCGVLLAGMTVGF